MMMQKLVWSAVGIGCAAAFGLVGCGGNGDPQTQAPPPPSAEQPTPATAEPPSAAGERADGGGETAAPAAISATLKAVLDGMDPEIAGKPIPEGIEATAGTNAYETHCGACHGAAGKGDGVAAAMLDPRPGNLGDPERARLTSAGARYWIVANGVEGSAMPPFQAALSEKQIWEIVAYMDGFVDEALDGEGKGPDAGPHSEAGTPPPPPPS